MTILLQDAGSITPAERAVDVPDDCRQVWCPLRGYFIDAVVCSRLQAQVRRKCSRAGAGRVECRHLDASWAQSLQRARGENTTLKRRTGRCSQPEQKGGLAGSHRG